MARAATDVTFYWRRIYLELGILYHGSAEMHGVLAASFEIKADNEVGDFASTHGFRLLSPAPPNSPKNYYILWHLIL